MNDVSPKAPFEIAHARDTYPLPGYQDTEARKHFIDGSGKNLI